MIYINKLEFIEDYLFEDSSKYDFYKPYPPEYKLKKSLIRFKKFKIEVDENYIYFWDINDEI